MSLKLGTVTNIDDPEKLRRIQVTTIDRGICSSQWIGRVTAFDGEDLPSPILGSTVIVAEVGGDSTEEIVLGVLQSATTNPPIDEKPNRESWWTLLREIGFWVQDRFAVRSPSPNKPVISLDRDGTVKAENTLGSVTLYPTGYITVTNPSGTLTMGAGGWNLNTPGSVAITAANLTWNGQTLARVGGTDSDGDTTLS